MSPIKLVGTLTAAALLCAPAAGQDHNAHPSDHTETAHTEIAHDHSEHKGMDHSNMDHADMDSAKMDHSKMDHANMDHSAHDMSSMKTDGVPVITAAAITAKVNGLVCDFCAQALRKVFKKEDAVEGIDVDLDAGEVRIALKSGATLSDETVKALIRKSGYSLVSIERSSGI